MTLLLLCLASSALAILFGILSCKKEIVECELEFLVSNFFKFFFFLASADWILLCICWATIGLSKIFPWGISLLL